MKLCSTVVMVLALGVVGSAAVAGEWVFGGTRAMGMGGAHAASARGAWSVMSNPAGLAQEDLGAASRISFAGVVGLRDLSLLDAIDNLSDYDWDAITSDPVANADDVSAIVAELESLNRGKGLMLGVGGTAVGAMNGFGAGVSFDFRAAFKPFVDLVNTNATPPGTPGSFYTNQSAVAVKAIMLTEVPVGYGYKFDTGIGSLSVGGALKLMYGVTYEERVDPTLASSDDFRDEITDSEEISMNVGVDLGVIYQPVNALSIGLLARNINSPGFDTATGEISEDAQVRAGVEWALWDRLLCLAFDADLNERDTIMEDYKEQWIGGGISIEGTPSVFDLALRLGAMQNIADDDIGIVYTAGFSAGFKWFHLSSSVAWSTEESTVDDSTMPAEAAVMLAFEATW